MLAGVWNGFIPVKSPPSAVPSLRVGSRPWPVTVPWRTAMTKGPVMRLYTVQTVGAVDELMSTGVLSGERARWEKDFAETYAWMDGQLRARVATPGDGMVWLWASTARRNLAGQLRLARGDVLLTVEMAAEEVLCSDFCDWHMVLNRWLHVPFRAPETCVEWERRGDQFWDDWNERSDPFASLPIAEWPADLRTELEASWEAIFEPVCWVHPRRGRLVVCREIQATVRRIQFSDVVRAVRIR